MKEKNEKDLYLLMGSIVSSLDTKSLPAELIFFHTDLTAEAQQKITLCHKPERDCFGTG